MNAARFYNTEMLVLLWLVPFFIGLYVYAAKKRGVALRKFAEDHLVSRLIDSLVIKKRRWKSILIILTFCLCTIAAARPAWNPVPRKISRLGRDVVFVLDVSRSMLAEDLAPNRLERAKLAILDAAERLQGDRVALVVFAGNAVVKCPLTLDYGFFRLMLEQVSPRSVSRGGTMIGDAIRKTTSEVFDDQEKKYKDIILITDGEDHESFPKEAAAEAGRRGIRLIAIGIGDENQGKRIPITGDRGRRAFLKYKGQEIWSKLDANTLREMVDTTPGGRYLNVATGAVDLGEIYEMLIASAEKKSLESKTTILYEEKFQVFVGCAFLLLCIEMLISERRRVN